MPSPLSHIAHWVFDLDNTLYRADANFFAQIDLKMTQFISCYLSVDTAQAAQIRKEYWAEYGTTLSGLMARHNMDPEEFLHDVHDVSLESLNPDPKLRSALQKLSGQKLIYTNGSKAHARNVASHLKIFDLFDGSFGIEDANYIPKPKAAPYDIFNRTFNVDPSRAIFFEDNVHNLQVPKSQGMVTVLVTSDEDFSTAPKTVRPSANGASADWVDYTTDDLPKWLSDYTA